MSGSNESPDPPRARRITASLDQLDPAPWNPKKPIVGAFRDGLEASLSHFGLRDDLKVWPNPERPGRYVVLDGNQRLSLLRESGATRVECRVLDDLGPEDARLFTAAFDRNQAVYDEGRLADLAASLTETGRELKRRLLRLSDSRMAALTATIERAAEDASSARAAAAARAQDRPRYPVVFSLTAEGREEVHSLVASWRTAAAGEAGLIAALRGLSERAMDSLVVETALRTAAASVSGGGKD